MQLCPALDKAILDPARTYGLTITGDLLTLFEVIVLFGIKIWSLCGGIWLVVVTGRSEQYLFSRQLWHIGIAVIFRCLLAPVGVVFFIINLPREGPLSILYRLERAAHHVSTFYFALVELQIAAGVFFTAQKSKRCLATLGRALQWTWLVALLVEFPDFCHMQTATVFFLIDGNAIVASCFLLLICCATVAFYILTVHVVCKAQAPSVVIQRATFRAMVYPLCFCITVLPELWFWQIGKENYKETRPQWAFQRSLVGDWLWYSNGWIIAAIYAWQRWMQPQVQSRWSVAFGARNDSVPPSIRAESLLETLQTAVGLVFELKKAESRTGEVLYVVGAIEMSSSEHLETVGFLGDVFCRKLFTSRGALPRWATPSAVFLQQQTSFALPDASPCAICELILAELPAKPTKPVSEEEEEEAESFASSATSSVALRRCSCGIASTKTVSTKSPEPLWLRYTYVRGVPDIEDYNEGNLFDHHKLVWERQSFRRVELRNEPGIRVLSDEAFDVPEPPWITQGAEAQDMLTRVQKELTLGAAPPSESSVGTAGLQFETEVPARGPLLPGWSIDSEEELEQFYGPFWDSLTQP